MSSVPAGSVPYSLSLSARVSSPHPISRVESNCPLDPLNYLNTEKTQATVLCVCVFICMCKCVALRTYECVRCVCVYVCVLALSLAPITIRILHSCSIPSLTALPSFECCSNCRSVWLQVISLTGTLSCCCITKTPISLLL